MVGSFSYATVSAQLNGLPLRTPTHERNGIKAVRQHDQGDRAKYIGVNRVVKGRGLESVCVLLQPHKNPHQGERGTQAAGEHKRGHRLRPRSEGRHQGESHGDDSRSELSTKGNESGRPIIRSHDDPFLDFRRYILYTLTPLKAPHGTFTRITAMRPDSGSCSNLHMLQNSLTAIVLSHKRFFEGSTPPKTPVGE